MKKLTQKAIKKLIAEANSETPDVGSYSLDIYAPKGQEVLQTLYFKTHEDLKKYIEDNKVQKAEILKYVGWEHDSYIGNFYND